eukprot:COSAG02_NODE_2882_length_7818_cov_12.332642_1_plen_77_part_00
MTIFVYILVLSLASVGSALLECGSTVRYGSAGVSAPVRRLGGHASPVRRGEGAGCGVGWALRKVRGVGWSLGGWGV